MSISSLLRTSILLLAGLTASACATRPPATNPEAVAAYEEARDPLEPFNRAMFRTDQALDKALVRPVVKTYRFMVPEGGRQSVGNALRNLRSPITLVHDVLQGQPNRAGITLSRFFVNTFIGVLGLFDVGEEIGLPYHSEDFGQTLAVWGVGDGPFIYVPLFGPSTLRDGTGYGVDAFFVDPLAWYSRGNGAETWIQWVVLGGTYINLKDETMFATDELEASSIDYYAALRSAYRQIRASEIRNGAPPPMEDFDEFSSTFQTPTLAAKAASEMPQTSLTSER
ncbi:MAG: VacJ family lipoprotein [Proteobacteria bacterium]|nr:VacJ family lipoprotein [Pseudomonadota bacterium]